MQNDRLAVCWRWKLECSNCVRRRAVRQQRSLRFECSAQGRSRLKLHVVASDVAEQQHIESHADGVELSKRQHRKRLIPDDVTVVFILHLNGKFE